MYPLDQAALEQAGLLPVAPPKMALISSPTPAFVGERLVRPLPVRLMASVNDFALCYA